MTYPQLRAPTHGYCNSNARFSVEIALLGVALSVFSCSTRPRSRTRLHSTSTVQYKWLFLLLGGTNVLIREDKPFKRGYWCGFAENIRAIKPRNVLYKKIAQTVCSHSGSHIPISDPQTTRDDHYPMYRDHVLTTSFLKCLNFAFNPPSCTFSKVQK